MRTTYRLLVINPSSTSTQIGVYDNEKCIIEETLIHETDELNEFPRMMDQYDFRKKAVLDSLHENGMNVTKCNAIVARGGILRSIPGGIYEVSEQMLKDLRTVQSGHQATILGAMIAYEIASKLHIPAYIVEPDVRDEREEAASISNPMGVILKVNELQTIAESALRVLRQEEKAKIYSLTGKVEVKDFK